MTAATTTRVPRTNEIRAKNEAIRLILQAAAEGDLDFLRAADGSSPAVTAAVCSSGCTALHWAAGNNQVAVLEFLLLLPSSLSSSCPIFSNVNLQATRKSLGRTPLHYSCRNGHLEACKWLVAHGANIHAKAKHGVTPFQLAIWQNRLEIVQWLVDEQEVNPAYEVNDFDCGAVHWIGICPEDRANFSKQKYRSQTDEGCSYEDDGQDLLPLARWLAKQPGIDFGMQQRQGHTALHKAAWGGHLAFVKYLHEEHCLWDDVVDDAGNFAASLADMANTPRHAKIASYLREECSRDRARSCAVLGVSVTASKKEIRKAYLEQARKLHPDRVYRAQQKALDEEDDGNGGIFTEFDALHKAYIHLTKYNGHGNQSNPAHSLPLLLRVTHTTIEKAGDDSFFKARSIAVLLEYGNHGMDVCNVKKKWSQVWPNEPFPSQQDPGVGSAFTKKIPLSVFLLQRAGDVIRIETDGNGRSLVFPSECSQAKVAEAAQSVTNLQ